MQRDLKYGFKKEDDLFTKIKGAYGDGLKKTASMCRWDYESDNHIVELKSRRNKYKQYPTTMIGQTKVDKMLETGKKCYGVFNFTDGIYSIELTKDKIDKFELRQGGRWDRGRAELNQYYYIPISQLTPLRCR
jgi:hypothetical protein